MPCPLEPFPEELRLLILSYIPSADLWLNVRHVNQTYRHYAEDVAIQTLLPNFTIGLNFTLSSSTHHKWYDVRGTVHHGFISISKPNPQFALFERVEVLPKNCKERVLETWNRMCLRGFGDETEWRVTFPPTGLLMKMSHVVMNEEKDGLWCDWRQLLDGYYERLPAVWYVPKLSSLLSPGRT